MHLADGEIVEVEGQVRRDIGIGRLFVRKQDVEADRWCADIVGAPVSRLHHARTAACDHDEFVMIKARRMA